MHYQQALHRFASALLWIKRPDNQSPEGLGGLYCTDEKDNAKKKKKPAKVNKEWLLLRNKSRERAGKAVSWRGALTPHRAVGAAFAMDASRRGAGMTSINRGVNELPNCLRLYSKQLRQDKYKKVPLKLPRGSVSQTSWLTFSGWRPFSAAGSTVKSQRDGRFPVSVQETWCQTVSTTRRRNSVLFSDLRGAVRRTLLPSHRLGTAAFVRG